MTSKKFPYSLVKRHDLNHIKNEITVLVEQIASARNFIKEIESGNLSIEFNDNSVSTHRENGLADSLTSMRDQMRTIAEQEKQRTWITEGLAKFIDILRSNNDDLKSLGEVIISNVIKYVKANQGSLYIINDNDPANAHLEMIACYAYDRKKHVIKDIGLGEGLVGQCVLEKSPIYMTNLPADYIKITSGLGSALPKNLLIVPLMVNENVYGVMEMASFNVFEQYHRDFIEKLGESIASTIANVRVNEQTRKLLGETQTQAEQMRSQEEEMRQSMEELTATQEEMQRILKDVEKKEKYLNELLNVSTDSIFTIDRDFNLVSWNRSFAKTLEQFGMKLQKGMNTMDWYQGAEEKEKQVALYDRVFNGESFDFTASSEQGGKTLYHLSIYAPLRNESGHVYEAAVFAKDVSLMMTAQKELQAQEEELRQNMEELKTTQEEMAKTEVLMAGQLTAINNSMATIDFSMDGIVLAANDKFCHAMGYTLDEITGKHHRLFLNEEYANSQQYIKFWQDLNAGIAQTGEFYRVGKGGKDIWISASYTVVKDSYGKPLKVIKFAMDITEQKIKTLDHEGQINAINNTMAEIEFDLEGRILDANDNFIATVGYSLREIVGQHHSMFVDARTRDAKAYKTFWSDLRQGMAQTGEFERFGKGGKQIWISASYTPIKDASGKVYKVIKFAQDITHQKVKSVDHEGQINAINNTMAAIEFDLEGKILNANELFLKAVGYSIKEIVGKHHSMFVDVQTREAQAYKSFWTDLSAGKPQTGEFKRFGKGGKQIWISASYTPIANTQGKVYKVVKFAQDITKQKLKSVDYEGQINAIRRSNAVIEFDIVGNILYANELFVRTMGYADAADMINRHHSIFVSEFEVKSPEYRKFWERLERGEFFTGEFQRKKANGQSIWIYGSYNPILDAEGKPYKVVKYAQVVNKNAQGIPDRVTVSTR